MREKVTRLAEEKGIECEVEMDREDKTAFIFDYCLKDVMEIMDSVDVGDQEIVHDLTMNDKENIVTVVVDEPSVGEVTQGEIDALAEDPVIGFNDSYEFSEEDSEFTIWVDEDDLSSQYLRETFGVMGGFTTVVTTDAELSDGVWEITMKFHPSVTKDVGEFRASRLYTNGLFEFECPECGSLMGTYELGSDTSSPKTCEDCLIAFPQPSLYEGVNGDDSTEELIEKMEDNFVVDPDRDDFEGVSFHEVHSVPGVATKYGGGTAENPDPDTLNVGLTEEYPPVCVFKNGVYREEEDVSGECWITGEDADLEVKLAALQEFESGDYVYADFVTKKVSSDVVEDIEECLGL